MKAIDDQETERYPCWFVNNNGDNSWKVGVKQGGKTTVHQVDLTKYIKSPDVLSRKHFKSLGLAIRLIDAYRSGGKRKVSAVMRDFKKKWG